MSSVQYDALKEPTNARARLRLARKLEAETQYYKTYAKRVGGPDTSVVELQGSSSNCHHQQHHHMDPYASDGTAAGSTAGTGGPLPSFPGEAAQVQRWQFINQRVAPVVEATVMAGRSVNHCGQTLDDDDGTKKNHKGNRLAVVGSTTKNAAVTGTTAMDRIMHGDFYNIRGNAVAMHPQPAPAPAQPSQSHNNNKCADFDYDNKYCGGYRGNGSVFADRDGFANVGKDVIVKLGPDDHAAIRGLGTHKGGSNNSGKHMRFQTQTQQQNATTAMTTDANFSRPNRNVGMQNSFIFSDASTTKTAANNKENRDLWRGHADHGGDDYHSQEADVHGYDAEDHVYKDFDDCSTFVDLDGRRRRHHPSFYQANRHHAGTIFGESESIGRSGQHQQLNNNNNSNMSNATRRPDHVLVQDYRSRQEAALDETQAAAAVAQQQQPLPSRQPLQGQQRPLTAASLDDVRFSNARKYNSQKNDDTQNDEHYEDAHYLPRDEYSYPEGDEQEDITTTTTTTTAANLINGKGNQKNTMKTPTTKAQQQKNLQQQQQQRTRAFGLAGPVLGKNQQQQPSSPPLPTKDALNSARHTRSASAAARTRYETALSSRRLQPPQPQAEEDGEVKKSFPLNANNNNTPRSVAAAGGPKNYLRATSTSARKVAPDVQRFQEEQTRAQHQWQQQQMQAQRMQQINKNGKNTNNNATVANIGGVNGNTASVEALGDALRRQRLLGPDKAALVSQSEMDRIRSVIADGERDGVISTSYSYVSNAAGQQQRGGLALDDINNNGRRRVYSAKPVSRQILF